MVGSGESTGFIAGVAVAALLGGGAVAASWIPAGSVDTRQIAPGAVTNTRLGTESVGTKKIKSGAVTTREIKNATIRPIDFSWLVWAAIAELPGRQGPAGAAGATGATGAPGPAGAQGAVGPAGACTAQTILNGSGPPAASAGNDGDFYIDTSAEVIYGPKSGGAWPTPGTSIVGPKGDPGPQGPTGATGPAGTSIRSDCVPPAPDVGNDGDFYIDTASSTLYGPKAAGAWPATGTSLVGPAGSTGATGPPGPAGPQGPVGPEGPAGGTFAPEYGQWSSTQTQGGAAFTSQDTVVPLTFNVQDITPTSGISVDAAPNNWNWRFTTAGTWAGGFSAQIRKNGNGTATVSIWWQYADPDSGCDEDSDFINTTNSATRARLASNGDQVTMTVMFEFPVPEGGMCGRLVANSEAGNAGEIDEMEIYYDPPRGSTRPSAPSVIANVWRIG